MQILLANAKIMRDSSPISPISTPMFQSVADSIAAELAARDIESLCTDLHCDVKIAALASMRYHNFDIAPKLPAIMTYNGQAYKYLKAETLDNNALAFAQDHLHITCFLYGLLRPMDGIVPYRIEPSVPLDNGMLLSRFWRDKLTDELIKMTQNDDGVLVHLSTAEYEQLFDWKRVCREVRVIQPLFYVRSKGALKIQAVWAKSCRGAMTRYIIENRITNPDDLDGFKLEGFNYSAGHGDIDHPYYING